MPGAQSQLFKENDDFPAEIYNPPGKKTTLLQVINNINNSQGGDKIQNRLNILVQWLILINTAVSEGLGWSGKTMSNKELSEWLFNKSLHPKGSITILRDARYSPDSFQEIEEIALRTLALNPVQFEKEVPNASFSIIQIWYKTFNPDTWETICNFNTETSPEINLMCKARSRLLDERIMVDQNSLGFYQSTQLGTLRIPKLEHFPDCMKPEKPSLTKSKFYFYKEECDMSEALKQRMHLRNPGDEAKPIKLPGLRLTLYKDADHLGNTRNFRTRVVMKIKQPIYERDLLCKLNYITWHSRMCHHQLLSVQASKGMKTLPNAIMSFIEWFHSILFNPKDGSLPIFGVVSMKKGGFKQSDFGPIQTYLINEYFSQTRSTLKIIQISLALICFWYQSFHPHFFFQRQQDYWKEMIEHLEIMLNVRGTYSVIYFDNDAKFIGK
ncbi:uncharacterized protein VP01_1100g4 [Puccinia sorghi]|uniref:Uncharacterized protein n=1 Tax=Puccinia sorghi TaxID=27349 RepID=A0A0L6VT31_9BASI|nr:uncharacterized protein VP01_1100g4 [Puccinia sorghi]